MHILINAENLAYKLLPAQGHRLCGICVMHSTADMILGCTGTSLVNLTIFLIFTSNWVFCGIGDHRRSHRLGDKELCVREKRIGQRKRVKVVFNLLKLM